MPRIRPHANTRSTCHWVKKLDGFLTFNERNILINAGKVSAEMAQEHAGREFEKFERARLDREVREPTSDFDRLVDETKRLKPVAPPKPPKKRKRKGE